MTNQPENAQQRPQYREDYKVKKLLQLLQCIEAKLRAEESRAQSSTAKN
jgi:hypothetical protein